MHQGRRPALYHAGILTTYEPLYEDGRKKRPGHRASDVLNISMQIRVSTSRVARKALSICVIVPFTMAIVSSLLVSNLHSALP